MAKRLDDVWGAAASISSDGENIILLLNRGGNKREKIVIKGKNFESYQLDIEEYIHELEHLPQPNLFMRGRSKGEERTQPYFKGQEPAQCGHFYPDVLRKEDTCKDGNWVRVFNCVFCGDYDVPIPESQTHPDKMLDEAEIERYRDSEKVRMLGEIKIK